MDARQWEESRVQKKLNGHATNETKVTQTALTSTPTGEGAHEPDEQDDEEKDEDQDESDGGGGEPEEIEPRNAAGAPAIILELAASCIRYVHQSVGVTLDFTAETLPLLDHYLAEAEKAVMVQSETDMKAAFTTLQLLVHTAGAYFGEVVRRRYPSWWRTDGDDPMTYRIELESVYLAFSPMLFVYEALAHGLAVQGDQAVLEAAQIEMDEEDEKAAAARLEELSVSEEEYYAPSTRLETIDVCVETIRTRRMADGDPVEMALTPEDYDT